MTMTKGKKIALLAFTSVLGVVALAGGAVYLWYSTGGLQEALLRKVGEKIVTNQSEMNLVQDVMGFSRPRTYLLLFLNNTELRPGGGFIGAYAVVRVDRGMPQLLKVEGTEILDNTAPKDFISIPPEPLKKYLSINRWNFRDSNWSPDFAASAFKSLELYQKERGLAAESLDAVIGFTPNVFEEVLKLTGPVKVNGEEFNSQNLTEKLEYEVEYGYAAKGIDFDSRKKMLADLSHAVLVKLGKNVLGNWTAYLTLAEKMLAEKHLVGYAMVPQWESVIAAKHWGGLMDQTYPGDYLLWADANLASLKTDLAIDRTLSYVIKPSGASNFTAAAKMTYIHRGKFDWRTTRYRTYARIFVPLGSKLIKVTGALKNDRTTDPGVIDQGTENGRQWFGAFIAIEPGKTGELSFEYQLPSEIVQKIKAGSYDLLTQKQIGTIANKFILDLDFGKKLTSANPSEKPEQLGDSRYQQSTDLRVDREFEVKL
ncbi:MAG: DUF4012 domain-containing protein [Patescibacteria group bacterium]